MSQILLDNSITQIPLRRLFRPYRILIMKTLEKEKNGISFQQLKEQFNLTDGNLATHLKSLEDEKYIEFYKITEGHKTKTFYKLTKEGKKILNDFTEQLLKILKY